MASNSSRFSYKRSHAHTHTGTDSYPSNYPLSINLPLIYPSIHLKSVYLSSTYLSNHHPPFHHPSIYPPIHHPSLFLFLTPFNLLFVMFIIYALFSARIKVPKGREFCLFCSLINPKHLEQPKWQRALNKYLLSTNEWKSAVLYSHVAHRSAPRPPGEPLQERLWMFTIRLYIIHHLLQRLTTGNYSCPWKDSPFPLTLWKVWQLGYPFISRIYSLCST